MTPQVIDMTHYCQHKLSSDAATNFKVGRSRNTDWRKAPDCFLVSLQVQLVVLVTAFVMVSTVWSVSCLLFYSRCPCAQPFVKVGGAHAPRALRSGVGATQKNT